MSELYSIRNGLVLDVDFRGYSPRDKSVYGNILTNFGSIWTPRGRVFDGVDDYIDAGNASSLNITDAITIAIVVKANVQTFKQIVSKYDNGAGKRSWTIATGQTNNNKLRVILSDDGTANTGHLRDYESSVIVFDNNYKHVVIVFNRGSEDFYINGIMDTNINKITNSTITSLFVQNTNVFFGAGNFNSAPIGFFNGSIDEVQIWNRALMTMEINQLYLEFRKNRD